MRRCRSKAGRSAPPALPPPAPRTALPCREAVPTKSVRVDAIRPRGRPKQEPLARPSPPRRTRLANWVETSGSSNWAGDFDEPCHTGESLAQAGVAQAGGRRGASRLRAPHAGAETQRPSQAGRRRQARRRPAGHRATCRASRGIPSNVAPESDAIRRFRTGRPGEVGLRLVGPTSDPRVWQPRASAPAATTRGSGPSCPARLRSGCTTSKQPKPGRPRRARAGARGVGRSGSFPQEETLQVGVEGKRGKPGRNSCAVLQVPARIRRWKFTYRGVREVPHAPGGPSFRPRSRRHTAGNICSQRRSAWK